MKPSNYWTDFEIQTIEKHYKSHGAQFCDEVIFAHHGWRRGRRNVMQKANKMGVHYDGERRGCFKKGQVPPNKGKKMSPELREKCAPTMFKKGQLPKTTYPPGQDTSIRHSKGVPCVYLRIALGKWVPLGRHTWESYYGKIPAKHIITFKDDDPLNCDVSNLECISMAQNVRRNHNTTKIKADAAELTDAYVVSYFKRYRKIELNLEDIDEQFLEVMRNEIKLKRSLSKKQQQ